MRLPVAILSNYYPFCYKSILSHLRCSSSLKNSSRDNVTIASPTSRQFFDSPFPDVLEQVATSMLVCPEFISENEERNLLNEVENVLKRIRYETSHWDDAITNYRETEHLRWKPENALIVERVRQTAFTSNARHIKYVHILDISKEGFIRPHVDSVRFCGDTITGISLLSDTVMRLALEQDKSLYVDILLNRRSLYVMR